MNTLVKITAIALLTAMVTPGFAQKTKEKGNDNKQEEIVIRKKNGDVEKMTIVVDGDDVTINGKPVDEFDSPDVTVLKRNRSEIRTPNGMRMMAPPPPGLEGMVPPLPPGVNKAFLGVMTEKNDKGVMVKEVTKESGAEKAGLQKGDVITKVGDVVVTTPPELIDAISKYKPDDKVDITYLRNGTEGKTSATLGTHNSFNYNFNFDNKDFNFKMPEGAIPPMGNFNFNFNRKPKIGLQIQDVEDGKGVVVKGVDAESPAAKAGLKAGDVITQLNGKDIAGVEDLQENVNDTEEGDTVKFTYKRSGKSQTVEIKIPKRLRTANL